MKNGLSISQSEKDALSNISIDFNNCSDSELTNFIYKYSDVPLFARIIKTYGIEKPSLYSSKTLLDCAREDDPVAFEILLKSGESPNSFFGTHYLIEHLVLESKVEYIKKLLEQPDIDFDFLDPNIDRHTKVNFIDVIFSEDKTECAHAILSAMVKDEKNHSQLSSLLNYAKRQENFPIAAFIIRNSTEIDDETIKWAYLRNSKDLMNALYEYKGSLNPLIVMMFKNRDFNGLLSLAEHGRLNNIDINMHDKIFRIEISEEYADFYDKLLGLGVELDRALILFGFILTFIYKGKEKADLLLDTIKKLETFDLIPVALYAQHTGGLIKAVRYLVENGIPARIPTIISSAINFGMFDDAVYLMENCTEMAAEIKSFKNSTKWRAIDALIHNDKANLQKALNEPNPTSDIAGISSSICLRQVAYETKNTEFEEMIPQHDYLSDVLLTWTTECTDNTLSLIVNEYNRIRFANDELKQIPPDQPSMLRYVAEACFKNNDVEEIERLVRLGLSEDEIIRLYSLYPSFGPFFYFAQTENFTALPKCQISKLVNTYPHSMLKEFSKEFIPIVEGVKLYMMYYGNTIAEFQKDDFVPKTPFNDLVKVVDKSMIDGPHPPEILYHLFSSHGDHDRYKRYRTPKVSQIKELKKFMEDEDFVPSSTAIHHAIKFGDLDFVKDIMHRFKMDPSLYSACFEMAAIDGIYDTAEYFASLISVKDLTLIKNAIEYNQPKILEMLISKGFDVHVKTDINENQGDSFFLGKKDSTMNMSYAALAAFTGHLNIVQLLLDKYELSQEEIDDVLFVCCRNGYFGMTKDLINKYNANPKVIRASKIGLCSALWIACYYSRTQIAKFLLEKGASVDEILPDRKLPLIFKAVEEKRLDIINFLAINKCNCKVSLSNGFNLLHTALSSSTDDPEFLNKIFRICALKNLVNMNNQKGLTPLILAVKNNLIKSISVLMQYGADPGLLTTNENGKKESAFYEVLFNCNNKNEIMKIFAQYGFTMNTALTNACKERSIPQIMMLINAGANKDFGLKVLCQTAGECDNTDLYICLVYFIKELKCNADVIDPITGDTLVHYLAATDDPRSMNVLIGGRARINLQNKNKLLALHVAMLKGNTQMTIHLIKAGSNFLIPFPSGELTFIYAIKHCRPEVVKTFLKYNAYINEPSNDGQTPLMVASNTSGAMVDILLEFNPDLTIVDNRTFTNVMKLCSKKFDFLTKIINLMERGRSHVNTETIAEAVAKFGITSKRSFDMVNLVINHGISFGGIEFDNHACNNETARLLIANGAIPKEH